MPVKPPAPKHTTQDLGDKLVIAIPNQTRWYSSVFRLFWLAFRVGLVVLLIFVLVDLRGESVPRFVFFLILLGTLFAVGSTGLAFYVWLWYAFGSQKVEVTTKSLSVEQTMPMHVYSKEYLADSIKDLRLSSLAPFSPNKYLAIYGYSTLVRRTGLLAFDYGAKIRRFAAGIDEAEAKQILAEIQQKFPQYRSNDSAKRPSGVVVHDQ